MIRGCVLAIILSVFGLSLSGCGTGNDRPQLGLVTGTVTMDGKPLYGVAVVFSPENGRPARGRTDLAGKYELTYIHETKGTKVGPNRVEIAASEEDLQDEEEQATAGESSGAATSGTREKPKIPARYNTKSILKADVKPGENVFDFQLDSKPSPPTEANETEKAST